MTTISPNIGQVGYNAGSVAPLGGDYNPSNPNHGPEKYNGYTTFAGSVLRNAAVGAAAGAVIGMPTGIGIPIGAGVGATLGAGSALIRHPKVAGAVGDGMKGMMAGAAGGALAGSITPFGPIGGALAGGAGGFVTGMTSGLLKNVAGGKFSIDNETTVFGRIKKGFGMGALSGATIGAGAGALFGGIGALPGALWGAAIGGIGGAIFGASTGVTDAATGAKGVTFTNGGGSGKSGLKDLLPDLPGGSRFRGQHPQQYPNYDGQIVQQSVTQCAPY